MVGMSQRLRSVGSPRRRRPSPPLGLLFFSQDCLGLVAVFLVGSRSSSVARAAGPSVACGSRSWPRRRARSHLPRRRPGAAGRGRALAAAAGAAAARRSRGSHFFALFLCRAVVASSALSPGSHTLSQGPVSPAPARLNFEAIKQGCRPSNFTPRGVVCPCTRGDDAALTR